MERALVYPELLFPQGSEDNAGLTLVFSSLPSIKVICRIIDPLDQNLQRRTGKLSIWQELQ